MLRVLADRPRSARFLILGSAAPALLKQGAETLAGRIAFHRLPGVSLAEVGDARLDALWRRGGLPRSFLARSEADSLRWRADYVRTFLERDLPQHGITVAAPAMRRFWMMLAHYHAQTWNASEFGRSLGVTDKTARKYLDVLTETYVIRQLQPWFANLKKRQVKSPRIFFADTGLLHSLLGIRSQRDLLSHPRLGASWEGFAMDAVVDQLGVDAEECYFWATHAGAELDLFVNRGTKRLGFDFKRTDAPTVTKSMRAAMNDLRLTSLSVVHAGEHSFRLADRIEAVSLRSVRDQIKRLR